MLDQIYLSEECCDKLHFDSKFQKSTVTLDPALALSLREWDTSHRRTFQTFIHHNQTMVLEPVVCVLPSGGKIHDRGWYTVTNPPQTRVFVTTDIDTELLREQRNVLLKISDSLAGKDEKLVSGVIIMLDHMLDCGEGS